MPKRDMCCGHTEPMSNDDQDALAKLNLFVARLQVLRDLVVIG